MNRINKDGYEGRLSETCWTSGYSLPCSYSRASLFWEEGQTAESASEPVIRSAVREPSFISIVLGAVTPQNRRNAIEAAEGFLSQQFWPETYASVMSLGQRLWVLNDFIGNQEQRKLPFGRAQRTTPMSSRAMRRTF